MGATGYTGFELVRLLAAHGGVELVALTSESYAGRPYAEVFPAFGGVVDLACEKADAESLGARCGLVFAALPHGAAMGAVPALLSAGARVVDLSADYRLREPRLYREWYRTEHTSPHLLEESVYGLPELHRDALRSARLVANPGCYPTGAIPGLAPLVREGRVRPESLIVDAKSGVSGAGRKADPALQFSEVNESFKAYGVGVHRHTPEIEQELSALAGAPVGVTFTPHLVPMTRGILTTIYADLAAPATTAELLGLFREFYAGERFVRVRGEGDYPSTGQVLGSNFVDIGLRADPARGKVVVVTALDNLVKGAAGNAVQNMNLMLGLSEECGLLGPGLWV